MFFLITGDYLTLTGWMYHCCRCDVRCRRHRHRRRHRRADRMRTAVEMNVIAVERDDDEEDVRSDYDQSGRSPRKIQL